MSLNDLISKEKIPVHFVQIEELGTFADGIGISTMEGDLSSVKSKEDLMDVIAQAMNFPNYFGGNWDSLDECLEDMDWLPADGYCLVLHEAAKGWKKIPYELGKFTTSWLEACKYWSDQKIPFHLIFIM